MPFFKGKDVSFAVEFDCKLHFVYPFTIGQEKPIVNHGKLLLTTKRPIVLDSIIVRENTEYSINLNGERKGSLRVAVINLSG